MPDSTTHITEILQGWSADRRAVWERILPFVYEDLRRRARNYLRRESGNHTIQTTALINEAYLRLNEQRNVRWASRAHFFAVAAQMMRRILVDYARAKHREKRGGQAEDIALEDALHVAAPEARNVDLLALDRALTRLAALDAQQAKIVELRYFGDLTIEETARVLDVSETTVKRDWTFARAWLHHELTR